MEHLFKFLRLPMSERWLLVKIALLLEIVKLGMRVLPFRVLQRLLAKVAWASKKMPAFRSPSVDSIGSAVALASRNTPGAKTCLTQALATQLLLARRGYSSLLHIGVLKGEQEQFQAHAWVESEGRVVIGGGSKLKYYTPLVVLKEGETSSDLKTMASTVCRIPQQLFRA